MILEKSQIIVLDQRFIEKDIRFREVEIKEIKKCEEVVVYDLTTETGFFEDSRGIIHKQCSAHSLRALAMNGLGNFFGFDVKSKPAKAAQTLVGHINTFLATASQFFAGAVGLDFVNVYIAPYIVGLKEKEIKQLAQYLVFSLAQTAYARSGQSIFSDMNIHINIPEWLKKVKAIGPGGVLLDKTYSEFEKESRLFVKCLLDVYEEGDANGTPFIFPKFDLHVDKDCFDGESKKLLVRACEIASKNGSIYFVFDKDSVSLSACCRLKTKIEDLDLLKEPERIRFSGIQNVTINFPQCAYRSNKDEKLFFKEIDKALDLVVKAHLQKKEFLKSISGKGFSMYHILGEKYFDGDVYINLDKGTYIVGIVGINEAVKYMYGKDLHESDEMHNRGLDIITYAYWKIKKLSKKHNIKLSLEETPAESTARRLAKVDVLKYPASKELVNGSLEDDNIYYTNSIHFKVDSPVDVITRIQKQSEYHPLIESGSIIHLFVGENLPSPEAIFKLVKNTFDKTDCSQFCISPEFTICKKCSKTENGLKEKCSSCGNKEVEHMTRIVGYYSKIENWNKSKQRELKDRKKGIYEIR